MSESQNWRRINHGELYSYDSVMDGVHAVAHVLRGHQEFERNACMIESAPRLLEFAGNFLNLFRALMNPVEKTGVILIESEKWHDICASVEKVLDCITNESDGKHDVETRRDYDHGNTTDSDMCDGRDKPSAGKSSVASCGGSGCVEPLNIRAVTETPVVIRCQAHGAALEVRNTIMEDGLLYADVVTCEHCLADAVTRDKGRAEDDAVPDGDA